MPTGGVTGNQGVGGFQFPSFKEIGSKIVEGFKAIGNKLCEFGAAIASLFKGVGGAVANADNNAQLTGATAKVLKGSSFTTEEKQQHMEQALNSDFYKACENSTTSGVTQRDFEEIARAVLSSPTAVAGMKEYGVTLDEAVAISMYTSQNYVQINEGLRTNSGKPEIEGLAEAFRSGLSKLPSFDGNPVEGPDGQTYHQVFRGARLPEDVANNHMIGANVSDPGIMSATFDKGQKFTDRINFDIVLLLKPGSEGKDISMFSDKPTECEVAFPPGVEFQVVDRRLDTGGLLPLEREQTYHPALDSYGNPAMGCATLLMKEI